MTGMYSYYGVISQSTNHNGRFHPTNFSNKGQRLKYYMCEGSEQWWGFGGKVDRSCH